MLLVDKNMPIDDNLLREISRKMEEETLSASDLKAVVTLFGQLCNHREDLRYELQGVNLSVQFLLDDQAYGVCFEEGACQVIEGKLDLPEITFTVKIPKALEILTGRLHSSVAHMNGEIVIHGTRNDALQFQNYFELFLDELC